MRPPAGGEAAIPRSRKSSIAADTRPASASSGQPTSFFLAREEDLFNPSTPANTSSRRSSATKPLESTYGVQSLEEALGEAFGDKSKDEQESAPTGLAGLLKRKRRKPSNAEAIDKVPTTENKSEDGASSKQSSPKGNGIQHTISRANTISQPLTPLQLESPVPESAMPSTPKSGSFRSLRLSDEEEGMEDGASQAITSGGEEDENEHEGLASTEARDSAPELVMPSLSMPSRRPFTERGKQMGRLKIAVAGACGVGKTSLIRAIVRQCEDIVHLDPISTTTPSLQPPQPNRRGSRTKKPASSTTHITEIQASTKAYPTWWSNMEDNRVLRRRKSLGETVLERNICFIDSPGFDPSTPSDSAERPLLRHIEGLFHRNASIGTMSDADLLGVLSGAGGVQVDVVLYVCQSGQSTSKQDEEYISKLSQLTNVVPIIGHADTLSYEDLSTSKGRLAMDLEKLGVNTNLLSKPRPDGIELPPFSPTYMENTKPPTSPAAQVTLQEYPTTNGPRAAFAVSCLPGPDILEMDASLLMSPSYSPPLVPSDLQDLVTQLFDPENIARLRHTAIRKFLHWREKKASEGSSALILSSGPGLGIREHLALQRSSQHRRISSASLSGGLVPSGQQPSPFDLSSTAIGAGLPEYTRARVRDHMVREERLAQVQLAKWASELQRAMRSEREGFERLAKNERAKWLLERIGEEVARGTIGTLDETPDWALTAFKRDRMRSKGLELPNWARAGAREDPLGLCGFGDGVKRTTRKVLTLLGGGVLAGAVWVAVVRAWGGEDRWFRWN